MNTKTRPIILITFTIGSICLLLFPLAARAVNIIPKETLNIDTSVIKQNDNFNLPDSIVISPLFFGRTTF